MQIYDYEITMSKIFSFNDKIIKNSVFFHTTRYIIVGFYLLVY
jgi:hypothetical protein